MALRQAQGHVFLWYGPFDKLRDRFLFGVALRQAQGHVFLYKVMKASGVALRQVQGPDLRMTKVWPFGKLRDRCLSSFPCNSVLIRGYASF